MVKRVNYGRKLSSFLHLLLWISLRIVSIKLLPELRWTHRGIHLVSKYHSIVILIYWSSISTFMICMVMPKRHLWRSTHLKRRIIACHFLLDLSTCLRWSHYISSLSTLHITMTIWCVLLLPICFCRCMIWRFWILSDLFRYNFVSVMFLLFNCMMIILIIEQRHDILVKQVFSINALNITILIFHFHYLLFLLKYLRWSSHLSQFILKIIFCSINTFWSNHLLMLLVYKTWLIFRACNYIFFVSIIVPTVFNIWAFTISFSLCKVILQVFSIQWLMS